MKSTSINAISALMQFGKNLHCTSLLYLDLTCTCLDDTQWQDLLPDLIARVLALLVVDGGEETDIRQSAIQAVLVMSRSGAHFSIEIFLETYSNLVLGDLRAKLLESEVADKILRLLDDSNWEIRQDAVDAINELMIYGEP